MTWKHWRANILMTLGYIVTALVGTAFDLFTTTQAFIWPPTGIAVAGVLLYGPALAPGVAVGAFVTVLLHDFGVAAAGWISLADTIEVLLAWVLLRRIARFHPSLDRASCVVTFSLVAIMTALISTLISVLGLVVLGRIPAAGVEHVMYGWWWSHASADLVIAPLLLTWLTRLPPEPLQKRPNVIEIAALALCVVIADAALFSDEFRAWLPNEAAPFYLLPLLLWAGLRFGPRGAASASFALGTMAVLSAATERGPFAGLPELQTFVSVTSVATLLLSAMALEKARAMKHRGAVQLAALDAIISIDNDGHILEFNPAAEQLFGHRELDVLGQDVALLIPAKHHLALRRALQTNEEVLAGRRFRTSLLRADGTEVPVEVGVAAATLDGQPIRTAMVRDRTAELRAERARDEVQALLERAVDERTSELTRTNLALERRELMLRQAEQLAQLGSFELELPSGRLEWSDELFRIYGLDRATFTPSYEAFVGAVHPDDRAETKRVIEDAIGSCKPFQLEERIVRPDGTVRMLASRGKVLRARADGTLRIAGCCQDVTDRHAADTRIKASLAEKEVLLREIHHRVKNNLQVISSLLNLQMSSEASEQSRKSLLESQNRIQSMALVHQLLYRSSDLGRIDATAYARTLASRLLATYAMDPSRIKLVVEGPALSLDIDRVIPYGLIINELVANALDHAFPDGHAGMIKITIDRSDASVVLCVRDNGVGIAENITIESAHSFGLQIARTLSHQLGGTIEVRRDDGTVVTVRFPLHVAPPPETDARAAAATPAL